MRRARVDEASAVRRHGDDMGATAAIGNLTGRQRVREPGDSRRRYWPKLPGGNGDQADDQRGHHAPPQPPGGRRSRRHGALRHSRQGLVDGLDFDSRVADVPGGASSDTLVRARRQQAANRYGGWQAGSIDQAGSRSRMRAMESETESQANARSPGQHLEQHAAEGPDVGPLVDGKPPRLLGAHVGCRAP